MMKGCSCYWFYLGSRESLQGRHTGSSPAVKQMCPSMMPACFIPSHMRVCVQTFYHGTFASLEADNGWSPNRACFISGHCPVHGLWQLLLDAWLHKARSDISKQFRVFRCNTKDQDTLLKLSIYHFFSLSWKEKERHKNKQISAGKICWKLHKILTVDTVKSVWKALICLVGQYDAQNTKSTDSICWLKWVRICGFCISFTSTKGES